MAKRNLHQKDECISTDYGSATKHEEMLFRKLFKDYNAWIRPVVRSNESVSVLFELFVSQLVKVVSFFDGQVKSSEEIVRRFCPFLHRHNFSRTWLLWAMCAYESSCGGMLVLDDIYFWMNIFSIFRQVNKNYSLCNVYINPIKDILNSRSFNILKH